MSFIIDEKKDIDPHGFTDVYIALIPQSVGKRTLVPLTREQELDGIKCERLRREKYYAWRLLEYAAEHSLGIDMDKLSPSKDKSGRWNSLICDFSISHTSDAVAVAISSHRVGVDIEELKTPRHPRFADRTLTERELAVYRALEGTEREEYLIRAWCGKEAVFKSLCEDAFIPSSIDTEATDISHKETIANNTIMSDCLAISSKKYVLSVFYDKDHKPRMFADVDLSED